MSSAMFGSTAGYKVVGTGDLPLITGNCYSNSGIDATHFFEIRHVLKPKLGVQQQAMQGKYVNPGIPQVSGSGIVISSPLASPVSEIMLCKSIQTLCSCFVLDS